MHLRLLLLAALAGVCVASVGQAVPHLTESDYAEETGDGKVRADRRSRRSWADEASGPPSRPSRRNASGHRKCQAAQQPMIGQAGGGAAPAPSAEHDKFP